MRRRARRRQTPSRLRRWLALAVAVALTAGLAYELRTSRLQARILTGLAAQTTYGLRPGASDAIHFPSQGAYDARLGYTRLPDFTDRLLADGYDIDAQARMSPRLMTLTGYGLTPPYREKAQAGLRLLDRSGRMVFDARYPSRVYGGFEEVPTLVVRTVLFLENRELLNPAFPQRNPVVEWDRLLRAGLSYGIRQVNPRFPRLGGSTLATQLEKIRHSPGGITGSPAEKLRQVASASVRAYLDGPTTLETQHRLVTDYLNAIPLAAVAGHGEVIGLGDGLAQWFGEDFDQANRLLTGLGAQSPADELAAARVYREVVTLLVANRRPSDYLVDESDHLDRLTESHLRALHTDGIIDTRFAKLVLASVPGPGPGPTAAARPLAERKATTSIRAGLASQLGVRDLYALDRLDLTAATTLDEPVQAAVATELRRLTDPVHAEAAGLIGPRLLGDDPQAVVYSFILYERGPGGNLLRVQADNLDQPLDVNESTKLELGSTAKLRTLVTYLETIAGLYQAHVGRPAAALLADEAAAADPLTRWTVSVLRSRPEVSLPEILDAALDRTYSASPAERFVTGGGVHTFGNFDADDNARVLTVREGFRRSVNLVFVRLMRDLVAYYVVRQPGWSPGLLADRTFPGRERWLTEFADYEGSLFLRRFRSTYGALPAGAAVDRLVGKQHPTARRVAAIHRSIYPDAPFEAFATFLAGRVPEPLVPGAAAQLYHQLARERMSLIDRAYVAGVHPLELWLVADMVADPDATPAERLARGRAERQAAYGWLFRTRNKAAQDSRIRAQLERSAFGDIHRAWQRLGYPFERLVPSYATALGSSGDNPSGLAELMGIIQSGGLRYPRTRVTSLAFAAGTPFETRLSPHQAAPQRVLAAAVAAAVRQELVAVVEEGTGRRAFGAFALPDGSNIPVGGKTGTGDNRVVVRGDTGRVLNRTATFTFIIGDRFHGTLVAYVNGGSAAEYRFTSALPVQVFRYLAPALQPLVAAPPPTLVSHASATHPRGHDTSERQRASRRSGAGPLGPPRAPP